MRGGRGGMLQPYCARKASPVQPLYHASMSVRPAGMSISKHRQASRAYKEGSQQAAACPGRHTGWMHGTRVEEQQQRKRVPGHTSLPPSKELPSSDI
eukprot:1152880-Pelagomonas_calceolata.AAC.1